MSTSLPKVVSPSFIRSVRKNAQLLREFKKVDPSERYVLFYPSSDNAHVGMGFNLLNCASAEEIYAKASEKLDKDILKMCLKGPKHDLLDNMENRDIATFVTSHATVAKLNEFHPDVIKFSKAAAGVGIGLINSLVFSGSLTFEDGLDLVHRQAQAIDKAVKVVPSSRIRLKVPPATRVSLICNAAIEHCIGLGIPEEIAVCSVSKKISPHVLEVSGHEEAIKYIEDNKDSVFEFYNLRRIKNSCPSIHTQLMKPVSEFIRYYINQKKTENSSYLVDPINSSVYSATSGKRLRFVESIQKELCKYPTSPIQLEPLIQTLYKRPRDLAQPKTLIVWDGRLKTTISKINRRAADVAKVLEA